MGTSASFARKISACLVAALLSLALVPAFALAEDGHSGAEGSEGAFGSEVPTSPQPPSAPTPEAANLVLPETVSYEGTEYALASIAPYAFYLSGVTDITLPCEREAMVDDRAFRSSDVASVTVAEGNPTYSSFDGASTTSNNSASCSFPRASRALSASPRQQRW